MTEPLPLVPATCREVKLRSGMAERLAQARDVLEPELDAEGLEREETVEQLRGRRLVVGVPASWRPGPAPARTRSPRARSARMKRSARAIVAFMLAAIDDEVEHAVLDEELAALEPLRQLLPDRLLDDARAGEADERLRLGDVQIAEHREARGDAAGRRIGQHRDERQPRAIEPRQRRRDLGHLHQRQRAFHHARAAGARDDDHRLPARRAPSRWRA